ncbi:hypothetical protein QFZ79_003305 [Arthrobacter sp. V4I6]|nr:hypothetical protein [Arthrobacter sp. V4I6]
MYLLSVSVLQQIFLLSGRNTALGSHQEKG